MRSAIRVSRFHRRRSLFSVLAAALAAPWLRPRGAQAQAQQIEALVPAVKDVVQGKPVRAGRVKIDTPLLAENGHSVPLTVTEQSPMSAADHVRSLDLVSEKNPRPLIAHFDLGPRAGRAEVVTRIRLNGSQRVAAIAQMSDGSYWYDVAEVQVTESACLDADNI
jgi:sulfur-oxidizing protein SoxY